MAIALITLTRRSGGSCSAPGAASVAASSPAPSAFLHTVDSTTGVSAGTLCAHRGKGEVSQAQVAVLHTWPCEQSAQTYVSSPSPSPSSSWLDGVGCAADCSSCMLASLAGASTFSASPGSMELAEGALGDKWKWTASLTEPVPLRIEDGSAN